ncbi:phosphotransferase [Glycomyces sp. NRRL B-16210]|uniref:aminoglycoside phosphotransferase family protein n=1 Tax=Glycomyces sp. NRRL B-16210 TaxID=1463821 RepID=UPI0004C1BE4C|nr:aminoglycoside 3'-phosphotransferase/choline kinase family protein [Glycomyces sp. NRRL B-16210]
MTLLPLSETDEQCERITDELLRPGVRALCAKLGLATERIAKFPEGSLPVYDIDGAHVLKLYPAADLADLATEEPVMRALEGSLPVPTPTVVATGRFDGWGYLLMTRLPGQDLKAIWPSLDHDTKRRLARAAGEALAEFHTVPPPEIGPESWDAFLASQVEAAAAKQIHRKLDRLWVEQIPGFLASVELLPAANVLLHTEFMDVHLLADHREGRYELTGLFDFEPALRGHPEYDLVAPGVFIGRGDRAVWREFVLGYGYAPGDGPDLARRTMAFTLLHRFANLPWYLQTIPAPGLRTFDELADHWFGI